MERIREAAVGPTRARASSAEVEAFNQEVMSLVESKAGASSEDAIDQISDFLVRWVAWWTAGGGGGVGRVLCPALT